MSIFKKKTPEETPEFIKKMTGFIRGENESDEIKLDRTQLNPVKKPLFEQFIALFSIVNIILSIIAVIFITGVIIGYALEYARAAYCMTFSFELLFQFLGILCMKLIGIFIVIGCYYCIIYVIFKFLALILTNRIRKKNEKMIKESAELSEAISKQLREEEKLKQTETK